LGKFSSAIALAECCKFASAGGYNGPFYNSAGAQLGSYSNSVPRIESNTIIQQVLLYFTYLACIASDVMLQVNAAHGTAHSCFREGQCHPS